VTSSVSALVQPATRGVPTTGYMRSIDFPHLSAQGDPLSHLTRRFLFISQVHFTKKRKRRGFAPEIIRIISARKATRGERRDYEENDS
jgi:hypothetical protein